MLLEKDANLRLLIQDQSWLRLVDPVKGPARQIRQGKCHKALAHCGLDKRTVDHYVYHFLYRYYGKVRSGSCGLYFTANEEKFT